MKGKPTLRMCVVCREMRDKNELIRIAKNSDGEIFVDTTGKAAGRGAFVCKTGECIKKCKKQRGLNRAFKCDVKAEIYDNLLLLETVSETEKTTLES